MAENICNYCSEDCATCILHKQRKVMDLKGFKADHEAGRPVVKIQRRKQRSEKHV
jgi:hypothetical protein